MKSLRLLLALLSPVLLFFGCTKEKSFEVGNGTSTSQWEFSEGSNNFHGKVDTAYKSQIAAGVTALMLEGTSDDGTGLLTLGILGLNPSGTGVYQSPLVLFDYSNGTGTVYQNNITAAGEFTIEITKIDSVSVQGVFSGKVKDSTGALKTITNGKFSARFGSSITPPAGTGQITVWSKAGCGAGGTGPIKVELTFSIATISSNITSFTPAEPACGAAGTATFNVPAGTYTYNAICGTDTVRQVITVAAGQCIKSEVNFGTAVPNGQLTFWSKASCTAGGNITVKLVNGQTGTISNFTASAPSDCTAAGNANFTLQPGTYSWVAKCGPTDSVTGSVLVLPSQCVKIEVNFTGGPPASTNSWSFTDGTANKNFSGPFDFALFGDDPFVSSGKMLYISGTMSTSDSTMDLYVPFPVTATQPIPGTYVTVPNNPDGADWIFYDINTFTEFYYVKDVAVPSPPADLKLTIVITSYDPVTKVVKGTFSGKAWNAAGNVVTISNGKFDTEVQF